QWSLAVTAFELLTGKPPWKAATFTGLLAQILADDPPRASSLRPDVAPAVDEVFTRGLAKSPRARFSTIDDFAHALAEATESADLWVWKKAPAGPAAFSGPRQVEALSSHHTAPPRARRWGKALLPLGAACVMAAALVVARGQLGKGPLPQPHPLANGDA